MIPFDFIYCRPNTLGEAYDTFLQLRAEGKNPAYYSGGSETITMCRAGNIQPGAVIDVKSIPECTLLSLDQDGLSIGGACTLNQIKESKLFPLLSLACGRIADHTNQCRITLGGNLCGSIIYRETSLPLLLSDASLTLLGGEGLRTVPFEQVFQGRMQLSSGELVVRAHIPGWALTAPHYHIKHTANEKIDYPLVSMAVIRKDGRLRAAFSGICSCPFRSAEMEDILNDHALSPSARAEQAAGRLPKPVQSDVEGSGAYRQFVLMNMLRALLEEFTDG